MSSDWVRQIEDKTMPVLAAVFVVGTLAWCAVAVWLSLRQVGFVRRQASLEPVTPAMAGAEHNAAIKAAAYAAAREGVNRSEAVIGAAIALAWALGGIDLLWHALGFIGSPLVRGVAFLVATGAVGWLADLPFALYRTFVVEARFGFNKTSGATFVVDRIKAGVLSLVLAIPLLTLLMFAIDRLTGLWWLWTWAALLVLMAVAPTLYIRLIAPRFNTFAPLPDGPMRERIEALLRAAGYSLSGLFTMDASRRTAHGNAFFIGFGRTKRIVLFDTLMARCSPREIEAVVAHELGHFRHRHVLFALVRSALVSFVALAAFGWLTRQPWLLSSFGVAADDPAPALFVCLLLASLVGPIGATLGNGVSRRNEFQADAFAGHMVGADPMMSALLKLAADNASVTASDPLYALVHHSHPSVSLRVERLRTLVAQGQLQPVLPV